MGEEFELSKLVNGVRFISSKNPKVTRFRVEIWVSFNSDDIASLQVFKEMFDKLFTILKFTNKSIDFKNIVINEPKEAAPKKTETK